MKSYLFHANQYKKFTTTKNTPNSDSFIPIPLSLSTRRQSEPNLVYRTEIETLVSNKFMCCSKTIYIFFVTEYQ